MSKNTSQVRPFPVAILAMALILEVSVFSYFVWHVVSAFQFVQVTTKRSMRIEELKGIIMRLDEVLTMSARMAVSTGDKRWEQRYRHYEPLLDDAIKESQILVPASLGVKTAAQTDAANAKLVDMEHRAFELVRQGHRDEAKQVLFSPAYEEQKQIYARGMDDYIGNLRGDLLATQDRERHRAFVSIVVAGIGLLTLVFAWGTVLMSLHRWRRTVSDSVNERQRAEQALRQVLSGAQCLLWEASVEETQFGLRCEVKVQDEDAAWKWMPLTMKDGQGYVDAWSEARNLANGIGLEDSAIEAVQAGKPKYSQRFSCPQADGQTRWLFEDVKVNATGPGKWQLIGACTDITDLKRAEEQLEHQAYHDALTGLPNRQLFMDRLTSTLLRARETGSSAAVLFIDFDNFKVINDNLGHEAGDKFLLARIASLKGAIRPGDILARLGGDEFVILLEGLPVGGEAIASRLAEQILSMFAKPVKILGQEVYSSVSIGVAVGGGGCEAPSLLRDADTAMYQVKTQGKSDYALFHLGMNDRLNEQMEMESGLRAALAKNEFRVHYQPLIDLKTGRMTGTEALVRWQHPTRGLIAPGKFIPVAEETGLIIPIGYWVMKEACRQTKAWQDARPGEPPITVSVNISGRQIQRGDVVERIKEIVAETNFPPQALKLEITESVMMKNMEETVARLHQLKALGIQLAVDDFGTGYSSMASLVSFPLDTIKIDRAFVARLGKFEDANATIAALVALGQALNMDVTSEGVETQEQLSELQHLGCTLGQGFLFAEPLTADVISSRINNGLDGLLNHPRHLLGISSPEFGEGGSERRQAS